MNLMIQTVCEKGTYKRERSLWEDEQRLRSRGWCGMGGGGDIQGTAGVPNPRAADQYRSMACWEPGHTAGGERWVSE